MIRRPRQIAIWRFDEEIHCQNNLVKWQFDDLTRFYDPI